MLVLIAVWAFTRGPLSGGRTVINEKQLEIECTAFYNKHINSDRDLGISIPFAILEKTDEKCKTKDKRLDYSCDLNPDDKIEKKDENFQGCCIPKEKQSSCPSDAPEEADDAGTLTG